MSKASEAIQDVLVCLNDKIRGLSSEEAREVCETVGDHANAQAEALEAEAEDEEEAE